MNDVRLPDDSPQAMTFWARLRHLRFPSKRGDMIAAQIGENASGVSVGKFIIQIGRLNVPIQLLLALIAAVPAVALLGPILTAPDRMPSGNDYNIAVAEFGQDMDGAVQQTASGTNLSTWIYRSIQTDFPSAEVSAKVTVWHDSLPQAVKRVRIGIIPGASAEERAKAATKKAHDIGANMLIYGNITGDGPGARFAPEFYIETQQQRSEVDDIRGQQQLGTPLAVRTPFSDVVPIDIDTTPRDSLAARTIVLALFCRGLTYDATGKSQAALDMFMSAEKETYWNDNEGKEIVWLFIGREYLALDKLDQAQQAFEMAQRLNPQHFPRALIGLANVYYARADALRKTQGDTLHDIGLVDQAITALDQAIDADSQALHIPPDPSDSFVPVKVHLALARTYQLRGELLLLRGQADPEALSAAADDFDLAIGEGRMAFALAQGKPVDYAARAYLSIGNAFSEKVLAEPEPRIPPTVTLLYMQAIDAYDRCIALTNTDPADSSLRSLREKYCAPYRDSTRQDLQNVRSQP